MPAPLHRLIAPLALVAGALVAVPAAVAGPAGAAPVTAAAHVDGQGRYVALTPTRVLDTRSTTAVGPGGTVTVDFSAQLPNLVVGAVVLNVTVVNDTSAGYVTVYPAGASRPLASSLNHRAHEIRANSVTVALPADAGNQKVTLFNSAGSTDIVVDLFGYYVGDAADPATASSYFPLGSPVRAYDTRQLGIGALHGGETRVIQRAGINVGGKPIEHVTAVAVTITALNPAASGYLRTWNSNPGAVPSVSTVNFDRGQTIPNFAIVPVTCVNAPGCSGYKFAVSNNVSPSTGVLVDVVGIYAAPDQPGATYFVPTTPHRVVDTRTGLGFGRLGAGGTGAAAVTLPNVTPSVANLNVTAVGPTTGTYLTVYADGQTRPTASNLNPVAGETASDAAQPLLSSSGRFRVYNANGSTHVVVDVTGAFRQD